MNNLEVANPAPHSEAWVGFAALSFGASIFAMGVGIFYLPVDAWMRGYLAMGSLLVVSSAITLSKTIRDQFEAKRLTNRVDLARVERLLSEYDPFRSRAPEVAAAASHAGAIPPPAPFQG